MSNSPAALAAKICEARDGGSSDADIIRDNADELGALLAAPAFLVIATTVLPLVLSIAKEMRGGKKLLEVLSGRASEIIEAVLAVVPLFAPKKSDAPNVAPIVPK